ncbi:MAG: sensor histidine kinase, partial [Sandaracinobacteroides sp.]
ERLKRRFGPTVPKGREVFDELTDTIIRQVDDLRRMVDEFSAFARMPAPTFRKEKLTEIARQALFLSEVATPNVVFSLHAQEPVPPFICDRRQIGQAFTNLLKNAVEAIVSKSETAEGSIFVEIYQREGSLIVDVADTGCGLPPDLRERLFEPYVTTRQRGTGLGLAIVKRIVEDHAGRLDIMNRPEGGVLARMEYDLAANNALGLATISNSEHEQVTS